MKLRFFASVAALAAIVYTPTLLAGSVCAHTACCKDVAVCCDDGGGSCCDTAKTQSAIANFTDPVLVARTLVSGPVLIVHDDEKMARGEACTTFYRFDKKEGPKEALVSFHCKPRRASRVDATTFTTAATEIGVKQLVEYQIAGDSEAHGVPK